jgi:pimeloyl-ACP methyl ester carboxylesterase
MLRCSRPRGIDNDLPLDLTMPEPLTVLLHGLWMHGFELGVLRRRLESSTGMRTVTFSYPSMRGGLAEHVRRLLEFAHRQRADELHFVGHSLGGLVILGALEAANDLPPGRAVLLGTPLQGSSAAEGLVRVLPFGRVMLGMTAYQELVQGRERCWAGRCDVGIIAGSIGVGLGRLFANVSAESDGTVMIRETELPGAKDRIVLRTSHSGMLFSPQVVAQTGHFLHHGLFKRE